MASRMDLAAIWALEGDKQRMAVAQVTSAGIIGCGSGYLIRCIGHGCLAPVPFQQRLSPE